MPDEQDLIRRLQARDPAALAEVFETYSDKIYRLALSLLSDEQSADGVVQDTFMTLIEKIDGFQGRSVIGTWLYRVAYNNCLGRLRKNRPELAIDDAAGEDEGYPLPERFIDWQTIPEVQLSSTEAIEQVARALETLSPNLRAVFMLRDVEELSTEETARALGIRPGAVKVRLHRARLALREALAGYFEETLV